MTKPLPWHECISICVDQTMPINTQTLFQLVLTKPIQCHPGHKLSLRACEVNTCCDTFCVFIVSLINTCWEEFCGLAGIGWPSRLEMHFVYGLGQYKFRYISCPLWYGMDLIKTGWNQFFLSSLACDLFNQLMFINILCPRCHWMGLVNTSSDTFYVLAEI